MLSFRAALGVAAPAIVAVSTSCLLLVDSDGLSGVPAETPPDAATEAATEAGAAVGPLGDGHSGALDVATEQVVNRYAAIVASAAAGSITLEVDPAGNVNAGDAVLVLQTTGLGAATSGDQNPIDLAPTPVGVFEIARVASVNGSRITLTAGLASTYFAGFAQLVTVPEYTTVSVRSGGRITGLPWDGARGGVVAFFTQGAIVNDGSISADALGFRGGTTFRNVGFGDCTALDGRPLEGYGAKGEGIFKIPPVVDAGEARGGRGNLANGGGGGNCHNAGAGGGAGAGAGGMGGRTCCADGGAAYGGLGGAPVVAPVTERLVLGGGGGTGDAENDPNETVIAGGKGGGIIFLRGMSVTGNGAISASGEDPAIGNGNGSPGGGGGGTIAIDVVERADCVVPIRAVGGRGGSLTGPNGTGGGGGGGRVLLRARTLRCTAEVSGGVAGEAGIEVDKTRGATAGSAGKTELAAP